MAYTEGWKSTTLRVTTESCRTLAVAAIKASIAKTPPSNRNGDAARSHSARFGASHPYCA